MYYVIQAESRDPDLGFGATWVSHVGTISRKTSESTDKFNGQNPLGIAITIDS
jgi:hypothetical protein